MIKDLNIDIKQIPFSRFGSYLAFSDLQGERYTSKGISEGVWLRSVHSTTPYELMLFELIDKNGTSVDFTTCCSESELTLSSSNGKVEICLSTENTVRIRVQGINLKITANTFRNHFAIPETDGNWVFNLAANFHSYRMIPVNGNFGVDAPWETKHCTHIIGELSPKPGETAELAIEELSSMRPVQNHSESFEILTEQAQNEFESFCEPYLDCSENIKNTVVKAAYLNWSSVVNPHGILKRPAMYMSKNWMTNLWAWDHAFNALATSLSDWDLGWDQLMIIFDFQDETGQIPDFINDVRILRNFVKPPIHGWILGRMIECNGELSEKQLKEAYEKLSLWTEWWFQFRDSDGDGLPVYWHGNDSGWDNGTVFDVPLPLKAADLSAFLIVQMDLLAKFADKLGKSEEADSWERRSEKTLNSLIDKLWVGNKFQNISTITRKTANASDSVFSSLPIILGKRLPCEIRKSLAKEIRRHMTEWGPATENPDSPLYNAEGYWRGPIWAPSTFILIDGLNSAGETELARDIAERFCKLCDKSGFAENFNAITGEPLCDPAYTWTSSVFLILVKKYLLTSQKETL